MRAVIYTRISRDDSGEGLANDRQEEACRQLIAMRGWEVVGDPAQTRDVSTSAYREGTKRPGWDRVVGMMQSGQCDVVVAWKLDRVTRRVSGLLGLIELAEATGVSFATTDGMLDLTSPTGKAVATILSTVAQMEVELKGERQRAANLQRVAQGTPWASGFRAFGYTLTGDLIEDEAQHIRQAAIDALAGTSMREIAKAWNALGLRSIHSKGDALGWTNRGIRSMLVNPRYAGIATYKGTVVGIGQWVPVFDETTHALLRARLTDPSRRTREGGGRTPEHLLSAIATCVRCGQTVTARTANSVAAYGCTRGCVGTPRAAADAYVTETFERAVRVFGPQRVLGLPSAPVVEVEDAKPLEDRRKTVTAAYLRGDLPGDEYDAALAEIAASLAQIERLSEAPKPLFSSITAGSSEYLEEFRSAPLAARRSAIETAVEVTLHPKGRGRRNVPIEDQVEMYVRISGELVTAEGLRELEGEGKA